MAMADPSILQCMIDRNLYSRNRRPVDSSKYVNKNTSFEYTNKYKEGMNYMINDVKQRATHTSAVTTNISEFHMDMPLPVTDYTARVCI